MDCLYCKKPTETYEVPSYHKNLYQVYECTNCKVPVMFTFENLTKTLKEISFYLKRKDGIYELVLQLGPKITKINKIPIDPEEEDPNSERESFKEFDYLLEITPDNFESKLETILTFI